MCSGATVPGELPVGNRRLLMENRRLRGEYMRATVLLNQILLLTPADGDRRELNSFRRL
jgi:homeobox-leucine zipper protein